MIVRLVRTAGAFGCVLWLGGASSGCLLESHEPAAPLPLERFCEAFFDALCEPIEACGCPSAVPSACRAEERAICPSVPSAAMRRAIDEGRLVYDPVAASSLVRRLGARSETCEGFIASLDWRVRDLYTLDGVFEGRVAAGEPCEVLGFELISECAFGSCAPADAGSVCRAVVGLGAPCGPDRQCADLDAPLTAERGIDRLTLRCVDGACAAWVEVGGGCAADGDCRTGLCRDDRCVALEDGASCTLFRECASGFCRTSDGTCRPGGAAEGERCDDERACASYVCVDGACAPAVCGTF